MLIYKSNISYDGTDFQGFQSQRNVRTVQDVLEEALRRIGWQGSHIRAAGRTDQGVHARGQVISYEMDWAHGTEKMTRALNAHLPGDVAVWQTEQAEPDFHPRFSARKRRYSYRILCSPMPQPLEERFAWRIWPEPVLGLMQQAAGILAGEHDFGAYGRAPVPGGHTIRVVHQVHWEQVCRGYELAITANAFLYHMVRRLTAMMVMVGSGKIDINQVRELLDHPGARWEGTLAPACGLCLEEVSYQGTWSANH